MVHIMQAFVRILQQKTSTKWDSVGANTIPRVSSTLTEKPMSDFLRLGHPIKIPVGVVVRSVTRAEIITPQAMGKFEDAAGLIS
jgi:hypothetical protein